MDAVTAGRVIAGPGTAETSWLEWLDSFGTARQPLEDWFAASSRLVVVAPHPDDEVLACGALLAMHAARRGECLIVAVTDGEASHGALGHAALSQLAHTRRAERFEGLQRLGLEGNTVLSLGLPDGGVERCVDRLALRLMTVLRPGDVVVSPWRLDGHPDHDAAGRAAARACAALRLRLLEAPIWMWHWATPRDMRVPWHRLRALAIDPVAWARKQDALAAHATQLGPRSSHLGPVIGPQLQARARRGAEYLFIGS